MTTNDIRILTATDVSDLLHDKELDIIDQIQLAYCAFGEGQTEMPHSSFLRFPDQPNDRIIALPAFIESQRNKAAGIKWISSFPGNHALKLDRASAFIAMNSLETGRTEAIMEGSIISAKRTAASAALAAKYLTQPRPPESIGLIGLGVIALETLRFLLALFPAIKQIHLYDKVAENCHNFREQYQQLRSDIPVEITQTGEETIKQADLICFSTNAGTPHTHIDAAKLKQRKSILNISLRDLTAETLLGANNVVDDTDHVCRANTSVHLAAEQCGHREFIDNNLYGLINGAPIPQDKNLCIFSPFGLGMLDIAIADFVLDSATHSGTGTVVPNFFPPYWLDRK